MANAGWYRDPTGQGDGRYWDGQKWGDQIDRGGVTLAAPMDPARATTPPVPGTEYVVPAPVAAQQPSQSVAVQQTRSSIMGPLLAALAVLVAVVALVIALSNNGDSDTDTPTTDPTEAPAPTEAPPEESEDGG